MLSHGTAEGVEEFDGIGIAGRLIFGMPLNPDSEGFGAFDRDCFDYSVGRACFDRKSRCEPGDTLAVKAVHQDFAPSEDLFEQAAGSDGDRMDGAVFHIEVIDLARAVIETPLATLDLCFERPAQHHIELLIAAADAEQRNPA